MAEHHTSLRKNTDTENAGSYVELEFSSKINESLLFGLSKAITEIKFKPLLLEKYIFHINNKKRFSEGAHPSYPRVQKPAMTLESHT